MANFQHKVVFGSDGDRISDPLMRILHTDVYECQNLLDANDTSCTRRVFVRAAFSYLDGASYWLGSTIKELLTLDNFAHVEQRFVKSALLDDEEFRPDKQGKLNSQPIRLPFLNLTAFVLRTAAELWKMDATPLFSDNGWKLLQEALAVRHRITHPKKEVDLKISDDEMIKVEEGLGWHYLCIEEILKAYNALSSPPNSDQTG